jgi:hypothetical protein
MSSSQFTCQICGQEYEQKSRLERHVLTSHPEPAPSAANVEKALSGIRFPKSKEEILSYTSSKREILEINTSYLTSYIKYIHNLTIIFYFQLIIYITIIFHFLGSYYNNYI